MVAMESLPLVEARVAALVDPALRRFVSEVRDLYGARLERIVLFGSRARGDHREDSDYDVAVFLHDLGELWDELRPLADLTTAVLLDTGAVISAKPMRAGSLADESVFMRELRQDGVIL